MTPTLLTVGYRLAIPPEAFRPHAQVAGQRIARTPGLVWKIWGLDPHTREGTSVYPFHDAASAQAFAEGPAIAALRRGPTEEVTVRLAPEDLALSAITGATAALAATPPVAASA